MAIINCPKCGNRVSTMALLCPHCSVKIADHIAVCPECEEPYIKEKDNVCKNCGIKLDEETLSATSHQNATKSNLPNNTNCSATRQPNLTTPTSLQDKKRGGFYNTQPNPTPRKKSARKAILLCLALLVCLATIVSVVYIINDRKAKSAEEERSYNYLINNFSIADAETFLIRYPESKHATEITNQIKLYRRYESEWTKVENSNNIDDFVVFERKFPNSPFVKKAQIKIDSLDWISAKRNSTLKSVQSYLNAHPLGKYITEAQDLKQEILDSTPTNEETNRINNIVVQYFNSLSNNNKNALATITSSYVYNKSIEIIDEKGLTETVTYNIVSPISIQKFPAQTGYNFASTFNVERVTAIVLGSSSRKTFAVKMTFTPNLIVSSVNMRYFE